MALSEPQIQQYGRQILLREVGGKGQAKLLDTPITIFGWNEALEVAATYLAAGGSPLHHEGHRGLAFLKGTELPLAAAGSISIGTTDVATIVIGTGVALRGASFCDRCWALAVAQIAGTTTAPVAAGSFAALLAQRQVLGFVSDSAVFEFVDGAFRAAKTPTCADHAQ